MSWAPLEPVEEWEQARRPRSWRFKCANAFRGIKLGMRGHSSYAVLFFYSVLTLAAAVVLRCQALEWCLLIGALGLVLTAELFYSALVKLCEPLPAEQATPATHIAMGAVLVASGTALAVGAIVFLPKLSALLLP